MYRGPVFDDFERFINEWLVSQDFDRIDWIFQSQSHFVTDKTGSISFDHTGRFEDLPATAEWLSHIVSRDIALTQTNRSSTGHYRRFYTPKTRDLVAEIYKQDVEQLQYDF